MTPKDEALLHTLVILNERVQRLERVVGCSHEAFTEMQDLRMDLEDSAVERLNNVLVNLKTLMER